MNSSSDELSKPFAIMPFRYADSILPRLLITLLIMVSIPVCFLRMLRISLNNGCFWLAENIFLFFTSQLTSKPAASKRFNSIRMAFVDSPNSSSNPRRYEAVSGLRKNRSNSLTRVLLVMSVSSKTKRNKKTIDDLGFTIYDLHGFALSVTGTMMKCQKSKCKVKMQS